MNKITNTTVEYIKEYLTILKKPVNEIDFNQYTLYMDFLPQFIRDFDNGIEFSLESIFTVFKLLSVEPTRSYKEIKDNFRFIDSKQRDINPPSKEFVNKENLFHILNLINTSIFLLKQKYNNDNKEKLKNLLIIMAINIYQNLYSSRGKMKFAYYFAKLLEYHQTPNVLITPYKSHSWRGEYGAYTKNLKKYISKLPLSSYGDRMDEIYINNIVIISGQMKDTKLANKEMQYFIQMGTFNILKKDFQPIFSTNFE